MYRTTRTGWERMGGRALRCMTRCHNNALHDVIFSRLRQAGQELSPSLKTGWRINPTEHTTLPPLGAPQLRSMMCAKPPSACGKPPGEPSKSPGKKQSPLFGGGSIFTVLESSFFGAFRKAMLPIRCNTIRLEDFQMPRIVVVGGESTGKSSLLENITKCAVFPRDKDICTRMPIRMQLTNATDASDTAVEVQFGSLPATRLQDSSQVLGAVQAAMEQLPKNSICDTELVVRIRETGTPAFEFVDLPVTSKCGNEDDARSFSRQRNDVLHLYPGSRFYFPSINLAWPVLVPGSNRLVALNSVFNLLRHSASPPAMMSILEKVLSTMSNHSGILGEFNSIEGSSKPCERFFLDANQNDNVCNRHLIFCPQIVTLCAYGSTYRSSTTNLYGLH
eukprot:79849-Pelagomonas_calceolata.AAC.4